MVLTVTLNASWDKTVVCPNLTLGGVVMAERAYTFAAGKGIDVARGLHDLGDDVGALGLAGGITGQAIRAGLAAEGIPHDLTPTQAETRSNLTLVDPMAGTEVHVVEPGGGVRPDELAAFRETFRRYLPPARFLALAGSLPPGVPDSIDAELVEEAQAAGVRAAVDTRGPALRAAVPARPWLLKPNAEELAELVGRGLPDAAAMAAAAQEVVTTGVEVVVVSLGSAGALAVTQAGKWYSPAPAVEPINTVGCGDALLAGLLHAAAAGADAPEMLRWGVAAGTANVLQEAPGGVARADVERFAERIPCYAMGS